MKTLISIALVALCIWQTAAYPTAPHPAVAAVRHEEEQLPIHLRKPALFNPRLQEILPLTSVLHHGEKIVFEREAEHIPREQIYKILTHAGFLRREVHGHQLNTYPAFQEYTKFDSEFLQHPELLQYL